MGSHQLARCCADCARSQSELSANRLPDSRQYAERYSLRAIKQELTPGPGSFSLSRVTLWPRLKELIVSVDKSDPELGIPAQNGVRT